nr:SAM-dependent chlorinase/fluorinase [Candidatus Njordarchaeota archaeon]
SVIPYFPSGTIHVAVVDPGVGGKRKALLVKTKRSYLIGPDNGILMLAANQDGIDKVFEIKNPRYMLLKVSSTFHGRDIFCAVAAHLANGISIDDLGSETHEYLKPKFSKPVTTKGTASGEVIHIDDFGNIVTNVTLKDIVELNIELNSMITVTIGSVTEKMKFCKSYGDVGIGEPLALIGGTGFFEVSINRGNAALFYKTHVGTQVAISGS